MQTIRVSSAGNSKDLAVVSILLALVVAAGLLLAAVKPAAALAGDTLAWGDNGSGQLGDGTYDTSNTPVQVGSLGEVRAVRGGCDHSLALRQDGTVWAWGHNGSGQLGNGTTGGEALSPVQVGNLSGVKAIATSCDYNLALKEDGTVWAWGSNYEGQLGNGTYGPSNVPVQVGNLSGVKAIAAGYDHSLALKQDGTVLAWGDNGNGQLGNGTYDDSPTPIQVKTAGGSTFGGIKAIAAGSDYSLALKSNGTVRAWGSNFYGHLGSGTTVNESPAPIKVKTAGGSTFGGVKRIATSGSAEHSLALRKDGTVWAWGYNYYGQLGNGASGLDADRNVPVRVGNLSGVRAIAAGYYHSLALKEDGTVRAWGDNYYGVLGNGTNNSAYRPVKVKTTSGAILGGIKTISAGYFHSLAIRQ